MTDLLFLDTETFSECPINRGTYRYAEDDSTEVMVVSWAWGVDGKAQVADLTNEFGVGSLPLPDEIERALHDPGVTIIGANFGQFDRIVIRDVLGIDLPPERIVDLMIQAASHGLPGSLEKLCGLFGIGEEEAKDAEGKSLIQLFCKPRPKNSLMRRATKRSHPAEWDRFVNRYAISDITAMQALWKKLPRWNYPGAMQGNRLAQERELWCLDQRINDRGFAVDSELARAAVAVVKKEQARLGSRVQDLTDGDVSSTNKRDQLLRHLLQFWGVQLPDMTKSTLEQRVNDENLPVEVREMIAIRLEASTTSVSKYNKLLSSANEDDRLRGTLRFCGAPRTGRWAGRLFQPQNMIRTPGWYKAHEQELSIEAIKNGSAILVYDSAIQICSYATRGAIVAKPGHTLVAADLSNIEGRVLAWGAGEQWKLDAFLLYDSGDGPDLYKVGAGRILGKAPGEVTGDERQVMGKVPELACGYQGAAGAFATMAALYGMQLSDTEVNRIVDQWRDANQKIVKFWWDLNKAAWDTVTTGQPHSTGRVRFDKVGAWLRMQLPSGRYLCYADAKIVPDRRFKGRNSLSYMGLNSYTRKWERIFTYGGKLAENWTQATARDVIANGMTLCDEDGFPVVLDVHDEVVAEVPDHRLDELSAGRMEQLLSMTPDWADGNLPLAAEGFMSKRYRK